ncbi:MAG: hypothetical protein ACRYG7_23085 [Janthinobacterium lividum]
MATTKTTPDVAAATAAAVTPRRAYLTATRSEAGELLETSRFNYLPGHPRPIRADLKAGVFNLNGQEVLGKSLTFIPVALRVFSDDILGMGRKVWAELFFIDKSGAVCAVLFHGYSVENLQKLNASLFYDDLQLTDVELTVTPVQKQTQKHGPPATYFIAEFSYQLADPAEVRARQEFAEDFDLYREATLTGMADMRLVNGYRIPEGYQFPAQQAAKQLPTAPAEAAAVTA